MEQPNLTTLIKVEHAEDHKRFYYNGSFLFINTYGELTIDFFEDIEDHTKKIAYFDDGSHEIDSTTATYVRKVQSTMIMTAERIPELIKQLQSRYDMYLEFKKDKDISEGE